MRIDYNAHLPYAEDLKKEQTFLLIDLKDTLADILQQNDLVPAIYAWNKRLNRSVITFDSY